MIQDIFPDESVRDWLDLPLPLLNEQLGDTLRGGLCGLHEASGIITSQRRDEMHAEEAAALEAAIKRAQEAMRQVSDLAAKHNDQLLFQIRDTLLELGQRVEREAAALGHGPPADRSVAASMLFGLRGDADDVWFVHVGLAAACVEWDVEPDGAWARVCAGVDTA